MSTKYRLLIVLVLHAILVLAVGVTVSAQQDTNTMRSQVFIHCGSPGWGIEGWFIGGVCGVLKHPVYEALLTQRFDRDTGTWSLTSNGLASSWECTPDFTVWTFHLRENVLWHDGEPFTSEDVKYTVEMYAHPAIMGYGAVRIAGSLVGYDSYASGEASSIEGIELVDEYTVRFHHTSPNPLYDWHIHLDMPIVPKHRFEDLPMEDVSTSTRWAEPIGTGPFSFVSSVEGEFRVLEAFDEYWGGRPKVDNWIAYWENDEDAKVARLQAGELEVTRLEARGVGADLAQALEELKADGYQVIPDPSPLLGYLDIQPKNENITWPVRRAIALAINREQLKQVTPYVEPWYTFGIGSEMLESPSIEEYNPEKAREILAEEGFEQEGVWQLATGYAGAGVRRQLEAIAAMLGEIGLEVEVVQVDNPTIEMNFIEGDEYELNYDGATVYPFDVLAPVFYRGEMGAYFNPGYEMPGLEAIFDKLAQTPYGEERNRLAQAGQALIDYYVPSIPLFLRQEIFVIAPWFDTEGNLANHELRPFGDFRFQDWHFRDDG